MILTTKRLILRPIRMSEAPLYFENASRPSHWGKGYATEAVGRVVETAFRKFSAHRVQATCWVKNQGSARVLEKCGFRREGRLRGFMRVGDRIRDEFGYGITRADFLERHGGSIAGR